jgi:hypothetical protein
MCIFLGEGPGLGQDPGLLGYGFKIPDRIIDVELSRCNRQWSDKPTRKQIFLKNLKRLMRFICSYYVSTSFESRAQVNF